MYKYIYIASRGGRKGGLNGQATSGTDIFHSKVQNKVLSTLANGSFQSMVHSCPQSIWVSSTLFAMLHNPVNGPLWFTGTHCPTQRPSVHFAPWFTVHTSPWSTPVHDPIRHTQSAPIQSTIHSPLQSSFHSSPLRYSSDKGYSDPWSTGVQCILQFIV